MQRFLVQYSYVYHFYLVLKIKKNDQSNFHSIGIDATQKTVEEGFEREIQEKVEVDDETKKLVDSRWSEYGL